MARLIAAPRKASTPARLVLLLSALALSGAPAARASESWAADPVPGELPGEGGSASVGGGSDYSEDSVVGELYRAEQDQVRNLLREAARPEPGNKAPNDLAERDGVDPGAYDSHRSVSPTDDVARISAKRSVSESEYAAELKDLDFRGNRSPAIEGPATEEPQGDQADLYR